MPKEEPDMTATIQTAPMANTARLARYRQAEQDLWHAYGLEPIERFVEVSLPRCRRPPPSPGDRCRRTCSVHPGDRRHGAVLGAADPRVAGHPLRHDRSSGLGAQLTARLSRSRLRRGRGGDPRRRARRPGPGSSRRRRRIDRASVGAAPGPTRTGASPADRGARRWADRGPARTALHPASRVTTRCR